MVKRFIRESTNKALELAKLKSHQKPQKIRCGYSVVIKNVSEEKGNYSIILPLPRESENQKIFSQPEFRPEPESFGEDEKFGNKFVLWSSELEPRHSATFNQYFAIQTKPVELKIDPSDTLESYKKPSKELKVFLKPSHSLKSKELKKIAGELKDDNLAILIPRIYDYVSNRLKYGDPIEGLYCVDDALTLDKVDCGGFSTLFIAICQQFGIPARLVSGFWATRAKRTPTMHAWAEAMLPNGSWLPADISTELLRKEGRSSKFAAFGKIGSDRVVFSYGCDIDLPLGKKKISTAILQNPIIIAEKNSERPHVEIEFSSKSFK